MTLLWVATVITVSWYSDVKVLCSLLTISFSAVISATIWVLFLPPVKHSIYFNRINVDGQHVITGNENHGAIIEDTCKKENISN
jgi:hypothetical protein